MIRPEAQTAISDLLRRLRVKGEHIAREYSRFRKAPYRSSAHSWRSARHLWPDLFED